MIAVLGGGPAGLAAATALVRAGRAVVVHEAGTYPRHRVCGEFLSPDAIPALTAIGLPGIVDGAPRIDAVRITASRGGRRAAEASFPLEAPGWGVARFDLDAALARHARREGAEVRERSRVTELPDADATLVATGRLTRPGDHAQADDVHRWIAVKSHLRGVELPGVTELHCVDGAYAGLNEVACDGARVVNVCALLRADAWDRAGRTSLGVWRMLAAESPEFAERMRHAALVESSEVVVAEFGFRARGALVEGRGLAVGDAAALTAPLSGAGQSAALASGVEAARCIAEFGDRAPEVWEKTHRRDFRRRLAVGGALQSMFLSPAAASAALRVAAVAGPAARWLFRATRGPW